MEICSRLLDAAIVYFKIFKFKFTSASPWTFPSVCIHLFFSKLIKASHSLFEVRSFALECVRVHAPSVPIYADGSMSSEVVGCTAV